MNAKEEERLKVSDVLSDVEDFMTIGGQYMGWGGPAIPPKEVAELRRFLIEEEADETLQAIDKGDLVGVVDGCTDLIYVALGTLLAYGVRDYRVWRLVHDANMNKLEAIQAVKREDGKVLKPEGWELPDVKGLLQEMQEELDCEI